MIYRILKAIYDAMDYDEFDFDAISPEVLRLSENKRDALLIMLVKSGYVDNAELFVVGGGRTCVKFMGKPELTLSGLMYLQENSAMQKAAKLAKGVVEVAKIL